MHLNEGKVKWFWLVKPTIKWKEARQDAGNFAMCQEVKDEEKTRKSNLRKVKAVNGGKKQEMLNSCLWCEGRGEINVEGWKGGDFFKNYKIRIYCFRTNQS